MQLAARRAVPAGALGAALGLAGVAGVVVAIAGAPDPTLPAVFAVALLLGVTFVLTGFGFAAGFRELLVAADGRAVLASLLIPAIAALVIIPLGMLGTGYYRFVGPIGLPLLLGAPVFGLGMQLANGCGSGTLVAAGEGSRRMLLALPCFCLGGVLGSLVLPDAMALPSLGTLDLPGLLGPWWGLAATQAALGLAALLLWRRGGWPSAARLRAPAIIGGLAGLLFLASGQPWGVTMGLTVAGAKAVQVAGIDLAHFTFWRWDGVHEALAQPLFHMHSALSDAGLLLGALLAASATGRLRLHVRLSRRGALAAMLGGLLMGVGGRLSFGCNIGAFVGGTASGSLHGLVWLLAVLPGCWLGIRARPWFGMTAR